MRISDWSSDVCSSDLARGGGADRALAGGHLSGIAQPGGARGARGCARRAGRGIGRGARRQCGAGAARHDPVAAVERDQFLPADRSEEHTSELQSLMRISYAVFCLKKKNEKRTNTNTEYIHLSNYQTE